MPDPDRPIYDASLVIDPLARTVTGSMTIDFGPDLPIDELILRLWPNGPRPSEGGAQLTLSSVELPTGPVEPELLTPTLARIPLPTTLQPGERTMLALDFELIVPIELRPLQCL